MSLVVAPTSLLLLMISQGIGYVYLMKYKSEAFEKFREYKNEVENQTGKSIKTLRSDRGGEYLSTEFTQFLKDHEILSQ